jgi:hypothetical protein
MSDPTNKVMTSLDYGGMRDEEMVQLAAARQSLDPTVVDLYERTGIDLSMLPDICNTEELARAVHVTAGSLTQDRYMRRGFPYVKMGRRIRYSRAAVARYLLDHHVAA